MQYFPAALERLSEQFGRLPGIGSKTAQRLAFHILSLPEEEAQSFADAIVEAKHKVKNLPGVSEPHRSGSVPHLRRSPPGSQRNLRSG